MIPLNKTAISREWCVFWRSYSIWHGSSFTAEKPRLNCNCVSPKENTMREQWNLPANFCRIIPWLMSTPPH